MRFLWVLILAVVLTVVLKRPIKKCPALFYAIAVAIDVLFICGSYIELPRFVSTALFLLVQKCTLSLAFFVIVMFVGVFAQGSKTKAYLLPVRAELSIIAWILSLGHMAVYMTSYLPQASHGVWHMNTTVLASLAVALALFALLLVLGTTSFAFVKKVIKPCTWKGIQTLAYPFFALVYVHLLLMLLPAALKGGEAAQVSVAVYLVVFIGYAALRLRRAFKDRTTRGLAKTQSA